MMARPKILKGPGEETRFVGNQIAIYPAQKEKTAKTGTAKPGGTQKEPPKK